MTGFTSLYVFTDASTQAGCDTRSFLRGVQSFPSPRLAAQPSLLNYLPIAEGRIIGFIPFPRVSVQCEMSDLSRIWTRVAVSISYDDTPRATLCTNLHGTNQQLI